MYLVMSQLWFDLWKSDSEETAGKELHFAETYDDLIKNFKKHKGFHDYEAHLYYRSLFTHE